MRFICVVAVVTIFFAGAGRAVRPVESDVARWIRYDPGNAASLRGLDVVSREVIWASGTDGTFIRTVDGGRTWKVGRVKGAEKLDFRDIEAFDAKTAYVLSIGSGTNSRIYKTTDGGENWELQFENKTDEAFFDSIAFWDEQNGMAQSDPVGGRYLLYRTRDAGRTWTRMPPADMPAAKKGEAAFAASGTCIVTGGQKRIWLITGGAAARVFRSANRGRSWQVAETPITSGAPGSGIFSIAMWDKKRGVIVGGNYQKPDESTDNLALTTDGGRTWIPARGLGGYRSGVAYIDKKTIVAVGSNGSDISFDGGRTWKNLDRGNYNAVQSLGPAATWAVGPNGMVARLDLDDGNDH